MKVMPLLACPPRVTTTGPVVPFTGTVVTIVLSLQLVGVAVAPLNVTVLVPCVEPKYDPLIVTWVPGFPDTGDKLLMFGGGTVNVIPLLA